MYTLGINRDLSATHFFPAAGDGPESRPHRHEYRITFELSGEALDGDGYLVDIVALGGVVDAVIARYREVVLNDLPEFSGGNPSIERFARILGRQCVQSMRNPTLSAVTVTVAEEDGSFASCRQSFP